MANPPTKAVISESLRNMRFLLERASV